MLVINIPEGKINTRVLLEKRIFMKRTSDNILIYSEFSMNSNYFGLPMKSK